MTWREFVGRLAAWTRREALDKELALDLASHVDAIAEEYERAGMAREAARSAAHRKVGNLTGLREQSRAYWGFPVVENLLRDLRYALRGLRHSPGFAVTVILTLGLGIGANAAMFGVIDRLMLRPFPYMRDPATVSRVYLQTTFNGKTNVNSTFPYTRFLDISKGLHRFSAVAALSEWRVGVGGVGEDVVVRKVAGVSASFFSFFDAPLSQGRAFTADEDALPLGATVAVISNEMWKNSYASQDVLGRTLKVGKLNYTIIGVAAPGFVGTVNGNVPDVFVPITTIPANIDPSNVNTYYSDYRWDWTEMLVRRKAGVSDAAASADLTAAYIASRTAARAINPRVLPDSIAHPQAIAGPIRVAAGPGAGLESKVLIWVSGVAFIVLLIACLSVTNLMLARVVRRRRDVTLRLALGASQERLLAQFITEGLLLALVGCLAGLGVAQWTGVVIKRLILPAGTAFNLATDWRTLAVAVGCAVGCALLTTLGPGILATRTELSAMLRAGSKGSSYRRSPTQVMLLVAQVALSVILLVGASLFVQSVRHARAIPLGYDARPVLEVIADYRGVIVGDSARAQAGRRLIEAARALPGVKAASFVNSRLFATNTAELRVAGIDSVAGLGRFNLQISSPGYFDVMHTRLVRGRLFDDSDTRGAPLVAVVSEAMAAALWPGRDAIGQCFRVGLGDANVNQAQCTTVVGIAENTTQQRIGDDAQFMYYLPMAQVVNGSLSTIILRMEGASAERQMERVRRELTRVMPGDGFVVVRPLQEVVDNQTRSWRLGATMFIAFGGLALVVAIVGLYGMISYGVAGRLQELGVRSALGATPRDIITLVVGGGVRLALTGIAIGLVASFSMAHWVQPLLFQQSARDVRAYVAIGLAMLLITVLASVIPARRASMVDPMTALRMD